MWGILLLAALGIGTYFIAKKPGSSPMTQEQVYEAAADEVAQGESIGTSELVLAANVMAVQQSVVNAVQAQANPTTAEARLRAAGIYVGAAQTKESVAGQIATFGAIVSPYGSTDVTAPITGYTQKNAGEWVEITVQPGFALPGDFIPK